MDWTPRQTRHPNLRLRDQGLGQQGRRQVPERSNNIQNETATAQVPRHSCEAATSLCPLPQPVELCSAAMFVLRKGSSGSASHQLYQYCGYSRRQFAPVLEPQEPYARCQCPCHGALPGDTGSHLCTKPSSLNIRCSVC